MTVEDIKRQQLKNQYLMNRGNFQDVVGDLCGIQAQFHGHAMHAVKIRSHEYQNTLVPQVLMKNWTLRGTMHLFLKEDLPVFLHCHGGKDYRSNDWRLPSFWNQRADWSLTPERQADCTRMILELLEDGPMEREALKAACQMNGMTEREAGCMFHPWGGGIREMCERGFIHYTADEKKYFMLTPEYSPLPEEQAELIQAERYFRHYGPATQRDLMYFFRITAQRAKAIINRLCLSSFMCEGKEYFNIGTTSLTDDIPACLFLSGFDPLMLGYEKKESIYLDAKHLREIFNLAGIVAPALMIHGKVAGKWKMKDRQLSVAVFSHPDIAEKRLIEKTAHTIWTDLEKISIY